MGSRAGRADGAPVEEMLCQSSLVHRHESLFLYNGWGWGALYPSKPLQGSCRRSLFLVRLLSSLSQSCVPNKQVS